MTNLQWQEEGDRILAFFIPEHKSEAPRVVDFEQTEDPKYVIQAISGLLDKHLSGKPELPRHILWDIEEGGDKLVLTRQDEKEGGPVVAAGIHCEKKTDTKNILSLIKSFTDKFPNHRIRAPYYDIYRKERFLFTGNIDF